MVAARYPHTAYSGLAHSLQGEWMYLQRMVEGIGPKFEPVEAAIASRFFPALLGSDDDIAPWHQKLRSIGAKEGGLGLRNPVVTAPRCRELSRKCTDLLVMSILDGREFSLERYMESARGARRKGREKRIEAELVTFGEAFRAAPLRLRRRIARNSSTGRWLNVIPNERNDTALSAEEFRDSLRIRCCLQPLDLPELCDGCGGPFTVGHALQCKKGNLVSLRHDDLKAVFQELMAAGLKPSSIRDEPYLIGRNRGEAPPPVDPDAPPPPRRPPDLRGDISAHGFWCRGTDCIFDVAVCDTDCRSYAGVEPEDVLARREAFKRGKYRLACAEQRRHFTPLVYSVDGMVGEEAKRAVKRIGRLLSKQWGRVHSECCGYASARIAIALVRSTSLCLRNSRVYRTFPKPFDHTGGLHAQLL